MSSRNSSLRSLVVGAFGVLLIVVMGVVGYALFTYGTVAPCGVLEQEIMARAERGSEGETEDNLLEKGAQALGMQIGEEALEARLEAYSSLECAEFMWRAKTGEYDEVREAVQ